MIGGTRVGERGDASRGADWARDGHAVSEVVGTVLLVGMTVVATAALASLILAFQGPQLTPQANIAVTLNPGAGGWNFADESIQISHLGGDALSPSSTRVTYALNGASASLTGSQLTGAFSNGFSIGEIWNYPLPLRATDSVQVSVVGGDSATHLLASVGLAPAQLGSGPACTLDTSPPTVSLWVQNPSDLRTSVGSSSVVVNATLADDCYGLSAKWPQLWWRINDGTNPAYAQIPSVMTPLGSNRWQGTVPAQSWGTNGGKIFQYQLRNVTDSGGNGANIDAANDTVDIITTYTAVATNTATLGTATNFNAARDWADSNAAATFQEGKTTTVNPSSAATATCSSGCATPTNALTSNNVRTTISSTGANVDLTGFTVPGTTTPIAKMIVSVEVGAGSGTTFPTMTATYTVGGVTGGTTLVQTLSATGDTVYTMDVTGDRAWTSDDINSNNFHIVVAGSSVTSRTLLVDRADLAVTYAQIGGTGNALDQRFGWTGVPAGTTETLQLRYAITAPGAGYDTFSVQLWTGSIWRTCAGSLSSTTFATFSCNLNLPAEHRSGAPQVRIIDLTPTSVTQTTLSIEYARIATV